jgi:hypothetical protein
MPDLLWILAGVFFNIQPKIWNLLFFCLFFSRYSGFCIDLLEAISKVSSHYNNYLETKNLKGQSHEKVGDLWVWSVSLGPN